MSITYLHILGRWCVLIWNLKLVKVIYEATVTKEVIFGNKYGNVVLSLKWWCILSNTEHLRNFTHQHRVIWHNILNLILVCNAFLNKELSVNCHTTIKSFLWNTLWWQKHPQWGQQCDYRTPSKTTFFGWDCSQYCFLRINHSINFWHWHWDLQGVSSGMFPDFKSDLSARKENCFIILTSRAQTMDNGSCRAL